MAALLLRRGRRWAAVAAILIEALWAALAAAMAYKTVDRSPLNARPDRLDAINRDT